MSCSDPQPSSDDIIQELLSSFAKSEPASQPAAQDDGSNAIPVSSAAQDARSGPLLTLEKKVKRIGGIKIASLMGCVLLREAAHHTSEASTSPAHGGTDDQGQNGKSVVSAPVPPHLAECESGSPPPTDGGKKHNKMKKKKSKKPRHERSPKTVPPEAKYEGLVSSCSLEGPEPAGGEEEEAAGGAVCAEPCSEGVSPPVPARSSSSSKGEASRGKKRPHDDSSMDDSSKSQPSKPKKSRSDLSPEKLKNPHSRSSSEKRKISRSCRSPAKIKKSRSSRSPEKHRKSRSSRSPEKHRKSRSSRSPEKHRKPRSSRSLEKHRKSRSSRSPEKHRKSRSSRSSERHNKSLTSRSPNKQKKSRSSRSPSNHRKSRSSRSSDRKSRSESRDKHSSHSSKSTRIRKKSKSSRSERQKKSRSSRSPRDHGKSRSNRSHSKRKKSRSSRSTSRRKRSRSSRSPDCHRKSSRRKSPRRQKSGSDDGSDCVKILKDKVTRKRLLEIARRNAMQLVSSGVIPSSLGLMHSTGPGATSSTASSGPRSVQDLTAFCKQLAESADYSEDELGSGLVGPDGEEEEVLDLDNKESTFTYAGKHPFALKDRPIMMNIRNAPMLPLKTNAERLQEGVKLREQFPVSSGSQHRQKHEEWTPVEPEQKCEEKKTPPVNTDAQQQTPQPPADPAAGTVFPAVDEDIINLNLSEMVSERLRAMRNLQDNPNDSSAKLKLDALQQTMSKWALSKQEPGKFTGSTGVKVLSQQELSSGQQAWAKKEQLKSAKPVSSAFGMRMMQKMGWSPGEGLGKNKEGSLVPLQLDVKMDKKGFHAQEELTPVKPAVPMTKSLSGKHPVSALVEHCLKCKWQPPQFQVVHDSGPDHKKSYLMKVIVNNKEYRASHTAPTKKLAKATAAAACLVALGLVSDQPLGSGVARSASARALPLTVGTAAVQEAFPPPVPLSSLTFHGMNITQHQLPQQQQIGGGGSISYSVDASSGGIQPLMSINACDYAGRNGNVNIIIGPQIPPSHSGYNFALQDGRREKVPLLPHPPLPAGLGDPFPPPGVQLDSFPPPGCGNVLSSSTLRLPEAGPKPLIMKTETK